jgi:hypothetical protein
MKLTQSKIIITWRGWESVVFGNRKYDEIMNQVNSGMADRVAEGIPAYERYRKSWQRRLRHDIGS